MTGRREFITLLAGAAAWPLAARAQQRDRVKRLGVLWGLAETDNVYEPYLLAFKQRLQDLGWIDGRNVRVEYWFTGGVTVRASRARHRPVSASAGSRYDHAGRQGDVSDAGRLCRVRTLDNSRARARWPTAGQA